MGDGFNKFIARQRVWARRGDVCDWLDAGHPVDELQDLIDAAPDLDAVRQAKKERSRMLACKRQRKRRAILRAAAR